MSQTDPDYDVPCDEACQLAKEGADISLYRFPRAKFADADDCDGIRMQARKCREEADEAFFEANRLMGTETLLSLADETWDTIHASETLLHMLETNGVDIATAHARVIAKNRERGYYAESWRRCDGCTGDECADGCTADQLRDEHSDEFEGGADA